MLHDWVTETHKISNQINKCKEELHLIVYPIVSQMQDMLFNINIT